jgi:ribose transport system permease protein
MKIQKFDKDRFIPYLGLIAIILVFTVLAGPKLLSWRNILVTFNAMYIYMIAALGTTFVLSTGNLDFSLGSLVGVTASAAALTAQATENIFLCLLAACVIGAATGFLIASVHILFKLNPFIVSVTVLFAYRGLTWVLNNNGSTGMPVSMYIYDKYPLKIGATLLVFIIVLILFRYTKLGRYARAIGSNTVAAAVSGVPVNKVKLLAFTLSGLFGAVAGLFTLIKAGSSFTTTGQMFETNVLIALTLGGMPLTGGAKAKLKAAIIGSISLAVLSNGLVLCGLDAKLQEGVKGLVLILIVALSFDRKNVTVVD